MSPTGWLLLALAAVLIYAILIFNRFVGLRQRLANAFSDMTCN